MKKKYISPSIKAIEINSSIFCASIYADPTTPTTSQYSKQASAAIDDEEDYVADTPARSNWNVWQ